VPGFTCAYCRGPLHRVCVAQHERTCAWLAGYQVGLAAGRHQGRVEVLSELDASADNAIADYHRRKQAGEF
jgi:hypothetical protein